MFRNRDTSDDDLSRDMGAILRRADTAERPPGAVVQMRPAVSQRPPLEYTACWIRSLRYEDMMQMATEMHGIKADDKIDTPEQLAKLVHSWAKATTETGGEGG